jgi:hypothetical protein
VSNPNAITPQEFGMAVPLQGFTAAEMANGRDPVTGHRLTACCAPLCGLAGPRSRHLCCEICPIAGINSEELQLI